MVSGGRGVGSGENYHTVLIHWQTNWAPLKVHHVLRLTLVLFQTTCKWVKQVKLLPDLYIAVGISGAIQHLAGIEGDSKSDRCDQQRRRSTDQCSSRLLVNDLNTVVPELSI